MGVICKRFQGEIDEQINKAHESQKHGSSLSGMSYEDGVMAALDWLTGNSNDPPMD